MHRAFLVAGSVLLLLAGQLSAFDAVGTLKSVDAERGVLVVFAGGQERTLTAEPNLKVLDTEGKDLPDGLKSPQLKADAQVTITVEPGGGKIALHVIRLGAVPGAKGGAPGRPGAQTASVGKPTVGFKPLTEMSAADKYQGEDGGLYGNGKNEPPSDHEAAAKKVTAQIVPLGLDGKQAQDGKIVVVSMSMSNATQEFSKFKQIADADSQKSSQVQIVDCAQGGQTMARWKDANANCWTEAERRLSSAGVSPGQVQVCWIKLANAGPTGDFATHGKILYDDTVEVLHVAKSKFPNLRIAYLGSRIYAGYADGRLNPEPYAYEGAFIVRRLILDQAKGRAELNSDPERGAVNSPLLLWGPYFWGDGMTPRKSDGLVWERSDLATDGTHPTASGQTKVAQMLLSFFKSDAHAKTWFLK